MEQEIPVFDDVQVVVLPGSGEDWSREEKWRGSLYGFWNIQQSISFADMVEIKAVLESGASMEMHTPDGLMFSVIEASELMRRRGIEMPDPVEQWVPAPGRGPVTQLYAWTTEVDGEEGLLSIRHDDRHSPCIGRDRETVSQYRMMAELCHSSTGNVVRLVRFTSREVLEEIGAETRQ